MSDMVGNPEDRSSRDAALKRCESRSEKMTLLEFPTVYDTNRSALLNELF